MRKKLASMFLAVVMTVGLLSLSACGGTGEAPGPGGSANPAASEPPTAANTPKPFSGPTGEVLASGETGEYVTWALYSDGTLVISGTGPMGDYLGPAPWYEDRDSITKVVIENCVTSIGRSAFEDCGNLTSATIPNSVTSIGSRVFQDCTSLTSVTIPNSVTNISGYAFANCSILTDVYYSGSAGQWNQISVSNNNDELFNATIHYNS